MDKIKIPDCGEIREKGGIKEMIDIAMPMVISQACYTAMTFTDRVFLSRLGPETMNAAMVGGLTVFMMMTFFLGLTGYATAVIAQYLGAGRKDRCAVVLTQAVMISFFSFPVIFLCRPFAHRLFDVMGVGPMQLVPQRIYFDILIFASIIPLLRCSFSAFFSGIGKTRAVMLSGLTAMCVNIGMNYVLIFGKFGVPAMGIRGAAYGTIIGGISGLSVLFCSYIKKENIKFFNIGSSFRFDWEATKTLFKFGTPAGVEFFLNLLAFDLIVMIFHSAGPVAATASTIVFNWDMVSFVPLLGVQVGVTSLVGRYMGSGHPNIAEKATMSGFKLGMLYSAGIFILFAGFPGLLAGFFSPQGGNGVFTAALPLTIFMIRFASLYVLAEAVFVVFIGALRGAGDTLWAMFLSVSLHWGLVPVLFIMLKIFDTGIEAAWKAVVGLFLVFSVFVYMRYRSGKWREIALVKPVPMGPVPVVPNDYHEISDL
ncbi:MAG: MATE family efflux transporter [Candidatus Omnitrophota bacterium]